LFDSDNEDNEAAPQKRGVKWDSNVKVKSQSQSQAPVPKSGIISTSLESTKIGFDNR